MYTTTTGKMVYLKPYDSVQQPRVSRYALNTLLCIFWNSSDALQGRLKEMNLMVTPYGNYHKLTQVADQLCSYYDKTSKNCGSIRLQDDACKHPTNQRKTFFSTLHFYACHQSAYSLGMAPSDDHLFHSLQHVLAENLVNDVEEMEMP